MELHYEYTVDEFVYSTDKVRLDLVYIHRFLSERSYWAAGVPMQVVKRSIDNSLCMGIYHHQKQVGFGRLVTDLATFAYLADVFIDEGYRGKGLAGHLMKFILSIEEMQSLRRIVLATKDAHGLYAQYGFEPLKTPERFMQMHRPDVYIQST